MYFETSDDIIKVFFYEYESEGTFLKLEELNSLING